MNFAYGFTKGFVFGTVLGVTFEWNPRYYIVSILLVLPLFLGMNYIDKIILGSFPSLQTYSTPFEAFLTEIVYYMLGFFAGNLTGKINVRRFREGRE